VIHIRACFCAISDAFAFGNCLRIMRTMRSSREMKCRKITKMLVQSIRQRASDLTGSCGQCKLSFGTVYQSYPVRIASFRSLSSGRTEMKSVPQSDRRSDWTGLACYNHSVKVERKTEYSDRMTLFAFLFLLCHVPYERMISETHGRFWK
jgi:hypothetical protein